MTTSPSSATAGAIGNGFARPAKREVLTEDVRYRLYRIGAHGSWWGAFAWLLTLTWYNLHHPLMATAFQRLSGLGIVFLIGTGIACGMALSRMRLARTITGVFETGISVATAIQAARIAQACVVTTDFEGRILAIENGDAIGWPDGTQDDVVGKNMDDLIPDPYLRVNNAALKQYRELSKEQRAQDAGLTVTFNLPMLGHDGKPRPIRITITRLGDTLIKTLAPLKEGAL